MTATPAREPSALPPVAGDRPPAAFVLLVVVVLGMVGVRLAGEVSLAAVPAAPQVVPGPAQSAPVDPATIRIPSIGVEAAVTRLGLDRDGALEVPDDTGVTGWWAGGAAPGAQGPAVIVGHLDSYTGPAVFHQVPKLVAGDVIEVSDASGQTVRFVVREIQRHAKDAFPTEAVYGPTAGPQLRLVTCGGRFDRRTGHYEQNVIAFADLAP